jgi:hypothetical protein
MNSIETIKADILAKAQKEIKKAETEIAIRESLPIQPNMIHIHSLYCSIGIAVYNATSKTHALEILRSFHEILPSYICRDRNTVSVRSEDDGKAGEVSEAFATVKIDKHEQAIEFYVNTPCGIVEINIRLGAGAFGQYVVQDRHRTKYYFWEFRPSADLCALHRVANYAPASNYGEMSARQSVWAAYEAHEIETLLSVSH